MLRAARSPEFWRMYARLPLVITPGAKAAWAYTTGRGEFPSAWHVKTPSGTIGLTANSIDDLLTIGECFGKLDYRVDSEAQLIIDGGANAGFATIYFLTHAPNAHVICVEPDPRNVERLNHLMAAHNMTNRVTVLQCAIGPKEGRVTFTTEATGRYGHVSESPSAAGENDLTVDMLSLNDVLKEALSDFDRVSLLKLDIEGLEAASLLSIEPVILDRVDVIYAETPSPEPVLVGMTSRRQGGVVRWRRAPQSSARLVEADPVVGPRSPGQ